MSTETRQQGSTELIRACWKDSKKDEIIIDTLQEQQNLGKDADNGYKKEAWLAVVNALQAQYPQSRFSIHQVKQRFHVLKKNYNMFRKMQENTSGFGVEPYRPGSNIITAPSDVWDQMLENHPDWRQFRYQGFPLFERLRALLNGRAATGEFVLNPHTLTTQVHIEAEEEEEVQFGSVYTPSNKRHNDGDSIIALGSSTIDTCSSSQSRSRSPTKRKKTTKTAQDVAALGEVLSKTMKQFTDANAENINRLLTGEDQENEAVQKYWRYSLKTETASQVARQCRKLLIADKAIRSSFLVLDESEYYAFFKDEFAADKSIYFEYDEGRKYSVIGIDERNREYSIVSDEC